MLNAFVVFAKGVLNLGGFRASEIPRQVHAALLTAFQDMLEHDVVMIEPLVKLAKAFPGKLLIDDTSNPKYGLKQWTRKLKILTTSGFCDGYKILLFLWECPIGCIPLGFALWHQHSKSLNDLVLEGLSQLRNHHGITPDAVAADAAFCTDKLLKRLEGYGWPCIMRFKSNRKLSNKRVDKLIARGYGSEQGHLKNGVKVKVFRRKNRFYVTNRMMWDMQKAVEVYTKRWKIEETFRALKQCLSLKGCQQHSMRAQTLYLIVCFVLFTCLQMHSTQSVYKTTQQVISGHLSLENLLDNRIFNAF
jgi:hypothetical protein